MIMRRRRRKTTQKKRKGTSLRQVRWRLEITRLWKAEVMMKIPLREMGDESTDDEDDEKEDD